MRGVARSPCRSSVARAVSSAFTGQCEVARDERDLGLGDGASRAATASRGPKARAARRSNSLARARSPSCAIRDAAKRQCRRIVAQSNVVQRAKEIARCERAGRRCNQGVHSNPDTLVTPTSSVPGTKCLL